MFSSAPSRILWPEHRQNGGTGFTKFAADRLPLYQQAIAELNDPEVFLRGDELHSTRMRPDIGDFWAIFRRIEREQGITCPTCKGNFSSYPEFTAHIGNPTCANEIIASPEKDTSE